MFNLTRVSGARPCRNYFALLALHYLRQEFAMPLAPPFRPDQAEAMHSALKRAASRLAAASPVIELVAIRIIELARAGEFDPDKLTETVVGEFEL
jgi:hypothetical protein